MNRRSDAGLVALLVALSGLALGGWLAIKDLPPSWPGPAPTVERSNP